MKALVTGANGFTGSCLVKHLLTKGYEVRGLVRSDSNLKSLQNLNIELFYADLTDDILLDDALLNIDVVFHIAAAFRVEGLPKKYFWDVNVEGTRKLLLAAKKAKIKRFVHCSTVGVQGNIKNPPAKEEVPYAPGDYYQESKTEGEKLVLEYYKNEKLPITVVRPAGIYGPGDLRFLKLFKFINNGKFIMLGSGNVLYHFTYVDDLVVGIAQAAEKKEAIGEVITIGGSEYITLNKLVDKISIVLNKPTPKRKFPVWPVWLLGWLCEIVLKPFKISPPLYRRRVNFFIKDRAFDISKAKRILNYRSSVSINEGLERTARWYKTQGLLKMVYLLFYFSAYTEAILIY
ncbi:MAG TPA: NAD-dependent epimerase/dehydratase family protein [Ignavibacteriaceae bacterium]|nr:NAD-dependent epimerase/dehydratase family protein [Ignavibacteriaceae bacterium]